jgi:hypothetical protein
VAGLLALPEPGEPGAPSLARYRSQMRLAWVAIAWWGCQFRIIGLFRWRRRWRVPKASLGS